MSTTERISFGVDTWRKGTRGLEAAHSTDRPYIKNMRLYKDNRLGPRPLWQAYLASISLGGANTSTLVFPVQYNYGNAAEPNTDGFAFIQAATARFYNYDDTSVHYAEDTVSGIDTAWFDRQRPVQITDVLWLYGPLLIDMSGPAPATPKAFTVTDVTTPLETAYSLTTFVCYGSALHQGRVFYWGADFSGTTYDNTQRVYYSDSVITGGEAAYGTFTSATQYFDVDGVVAGCVSVGSNLFIWTRDGKWTVMQGSGDPAKATFNYIGEGRIPDTQALPVRVGNIALFLSSDGQAVVTLNAGGTLDDVTWGHLGVTAEPEEYFTAVSASPAANPRLNTILLPGPGGSIHGKHFWNGMWADDSSLTDSYTFYARNGANVEFREYSTLPSPFTTWYKRVQIRDMGVSSPSASPATDFSEYAELYSTSSVKGEVHLPRIMAPSKQVRVSRVIIDGVVWAGSTYATPGLTVTIADGKGNSTNLTLGPGADPIGDLGDGAALPVRLVATGAPTAYTHFADVQITGLVGVAIENVTVEYEISEGPIQ